MAGGAEAEFEEFAARDGGRLLGFAPASADVAAAVLDRQLLLRACRVLPVQQRAVLVLRFWEDRSVDETAALLGCSAGTVKSHTHRALARLRLVLQDAPEAKAGAIGGKRHADRS